MTRRLAGLCYLCGDPTEHEWFCAGHLWASVREVQPGYMVQPVCSHLGPHHAYWVERFTPGEVTELAKHITLEALV